jgi:WD40 repeat protein
VKGEKDDYLMQGGFLLEIQEHWQDLSNHLMPSIHDFYQRSQKLDIHKRILIEYPHSERELREQALQTKWLVSHNLEEATIATIRDTGRSLVKLQGIVLESTQTNLRELANRFYVPKCITSSEEIRSFTLSPDGKKIAISTKNSGIQILDLAGDLILEISSFSRHSTGHDIGLLVFTPDSQKVIGSDRAKIGMWDLFGNQTGTILNAFKANNSWIHNIVCLPDSEHIASISETGALCLWDFNGKLLFRLQEEENVMSVAFSPDSQWFATGHHYNNDIQLWSNTGNSTGKLFSSAQTHPYAINFSPDGQTIAGGGGSTIAIWNSDGNVKEQLTDAEYSRSRYNITSIIFSPDGQTIATSSEGELLSEPSIIRLWDLDAKPIGVPLAITQHLNSSIFFTPDGKYLVGSDSNKITFLLSATWEEWLRICCNHLRYHPSLNDPNNPTAVEACEVCRKYVWESEEN